MHKCFPFTVFCFGLVGYFRGPLFALFPLLVTQICVYFIKHHLVASQHRCLSSPSTGPQFFQRCFSNILLLFYHHKVTRHSWATFFREIVWQYRKASLETFSFIHQMTDEHWPWMQTLQIYQPMPHFQLQLSLMDIEKHCQLIRHHQPNTNFLVYLVLSYQI